MPKVFEPWNTYDTGAYGVPTVGYGVGQGGWGNMNLSVHACQQPGVGRK
jgi:hypothetical protein